MITVPNSKNVGRSPNSKTCGTVLSKALVPFLALMVLLLVTWTLLDWIYLKTPSELRANSDWTVLVLAVYPGLAGFVTWHRSKFRPLGWRIGLTVLSVFSFCVIAAGLLLTLGLEIHFWLGGSV